MTKLPMESLAKKAGLTVSLAELWSEQEALYLPLESSDQLRQVGSTTIPFVGWGGVYRS